jgi:hypothetical protein
VFVGGFGSTTVTAQHDHEAMMKAEAKISQTLASLSPADQQLAKAQRFCPMMEYNRLGAMESPIKAMVDGKPVFVCCEDCVEAAKAGGETTLKKAQELIDVSATLAKLPADERMAIEAQKYCVVANKNLLGSMGAPVKLEIEGKPVYLCCKGCVTKARANPAATLAKVEVLKAAGMHDDGHDHGNH